MRTKQICRYIAFTAILTTSGCSLVGPKCQRIKLSDIFKKNVIYCEDPNKELFEIWKKEKSEGILYYKFKGKYYTETQMDSIGDVINDQITRQMIRELDSTNLKHN
jgi:hypothetical protein